MAYNGPFDVYSGKIPRFWPGLAWSLSVPSPTGLTGPDHSWSRLVLARSQGSGHGPGRGGGRSGVGGSLIPLTSRSPTWGVWRGGSPTQSLGPPDWSQHPEFSLMAGSMNFPSCGVFHQRSPYTVPSNFPANLMHLIGKTQTKTKYV